ncbi:MAG: hypothetical protein ACK4UN_19570 [Limisphaerales bacterium]
MTDFLIQISDCKFACLTLIGLSALLCIYNLICRLIENWEDKE